MKHFYFITIFPENILIPIRCSITGRAEKKNITSYTAVDPRTFTNDLHRTIDDKPYGGGPGMVMKAEPISKAIESLNLPTDTEIILTDPVAPLFTQEDAKDLSTKKHITFICGHYEGIDERIRDTYATRVYSIGDYILTGGELPALVMADSIIRLIPGVLGSQESLDIDSYSQQHLSYPQYTRPEVWNGMEIPEVLKSGHHKNIEAWRKNQSLLRTKKYRPHLFNKMINTDPLI